MASLHDIEAAIQAQLTPVVSNLNFQELPIQVKIGIGWPPEKALQENVRGVSAVISIYDRKIAKNSTRWKPITLSSTVQEATLTSTLSNSALDAGQSVTLTLGGSITAGDAVSLVAFSGTTQTSPGVYTLSAATVAIGTDGQGRTALAAILAEQINADMLLSQFMSASASGHVITLTSLLTAGTIKLQSNTGNGGINIREIGRRERNFQVVIWAPTSDIRTILTSAVEVLFTQLEIYNGVSMPDGTFGRFFNQNDFDIEDASHYDTYRHDFLFSIDYPITEQDALFAVLAPISQFQVDN